MTCSLCHSREVLGVRLPMLQAAILDRVRRAGDEGVTSVEILTDCFQDRRPVKISVVKAHVFQINDMLLATDWRIHSDRRRWFLERVAPD
jgi:hypothetical protein